jgi:hypothetical protein
MLNRLKLAAKIILRGSPDQSSRAPIPAITADEVAEARVFFPMEKFFVFGHARSGTTLLMRLLDVHPEVHCSRQAHFFTRGPYLEGLVQDPAVAQWLARGSVRWNRGSDLSAPLLRAAADFILERDARKAGAAIVGDKSPNSLNDGEAVERMHKIYPDGKLIYIIRDGRDAVLSHRFQAFIDATQHLSPEDWRIRQAFEAEPDSFKGDQRSLFTEQGIREYAAGWVRNVESTLAAAQSLYADGHHVMRYEILLAGATQQMKQAWEFLGASDFAEADQQVAETIGLNRDARWQQQKAGDFASSIPKGKSGGWQGYFSARDRAIFADVAGETLVAWDYSI